jgi:hypothetical protein
MEDSSLTYDEGHQISALDFAECQFWCHNLCQNKCLKWSLARITFQNCFIGWYKHIKMHCKQPSKEGSNHVENKT